MGVWRNIGKGVWEYRGENQDIAAALGGRFLSAAKRHQVRGSTADIAFKGVQSAVDSRPELRGIPEVYMLTYVEDFRGAITQEIGDASGRKLLSAIKSASDTRLD